MLNVLQKLCVRLLLVAYKWIRAADICCFGRQSICVLHFIITTQHFYCYWPKLEMYHIVQTLNTVLRFSFTIAQGFRYNEIVN